VPARIRAALLKTGVRAINRFGMWSRAVLSPTRLQICVAIDQPCPTTFAPPTRRSCTNRRSSSRRSCEHKRSGIALAAVRTRPSSSIARVVIGMCPENVFFAGIQKRGAAQHVIEAAARSPCTAFHHVRKRGSAVGDRRRDDDTAEQSRFTGNRRGAWIERGATLKLSHSLSTRAKKKQMRMAF